MSKGEPRHLFLQSFGLITIIATAALATSALLEPANASSKAQSQYPVVYPREQTLITTGTQWGRIKGFNPYKNDYAVGTVGLCNETLLRYDPLKDKYIPWLARSARWTNPKTYTVVIRSGIKWGDGRPFTPKDVAFNFRLGRFKTAFWHELYTSLRSIKASGLTVAFSFRKTPSYAQWQNLLWNLPMVNPGQTASIQSAQALISYNPANPIGTGPYELDIAGYDPAVKVVWKKKASWWAAEQGLSPSPKPRYIIDLVLGTISCLDVDGCPSLYKGGPDLLGQYLGFLVGTEHAAHTYFKGRPYNLSANTAWLTPNTTHEPLNDYKFRKALATAINVNKIVNDDYKGLVTKADATGLLPIWKKWINKALVKKYGFKYSTARAISMLKKAGYKIKKGYFVNKDGSELTLSIIVPQGWSDWETARDMIIESAKKAKIHVEATTGDFNVYMNLRNTGGFDLVVDNTAQMSDNPWTYFNFLYHQPIIKTGSGQTFANYSRFGQSPKDRGAANAAWKLVQKLDQTPLNKTSARKALMSKLEKITLTRIPNIPLWYNGVWAQMSNDNWTNWPSHESGRHYLPCMWRGYMQMTAIDMITHIKHT